MPTKMHEDLYHCHACDRLTVDRDVTDAWHYAAYNAQFGVTNRSSSAIVAVDISGTSVRQMQAPPSTFPGEEDFNV